MLKKIIIAIFAFIIQFYSHAQTAQDGLAILFGLLDAKDEQQLLYKSYDNLDGKEKLFAEKVAVEYEYFILRSNALQVHFRLYSRMNDNDKKAEDKVIVHVIKNYLTQSQLSIENLSSINNSSNSIPVKEGIDKLLRRINSSIERMNKISNK